MSLVPRAAPVRPTVALLALLSLAGCASSAASGSPATSAGPSPSGPAGSERTVLIAMTDAGCAPAPATITSGPLTFRIVNQDSTKASEVELVEGDRILGEKENLTPGLSTSFSLELAAGDYEIYCPGATTERWPLTVTAGSAAPSGAVTSPSTDAALTAALKAATIGYATDVRHTGSAVFACPPGLGSSGWWGDTLLG